MKPDDAELNPGMGGATFATTHWSMVYAARGESAAARAAMENLCRIYWRPIYSYLRREGRTLEDAQDLTQGFFARLLERHDFAAVQREKGRLRSYLLVALKHYLANERQRAHAIKRGGGRPLVPLDQLISRERSDPEPAEHLTADRIYERRWALTVLEQVLEQLASEYAAAGNSTLFGYFRDSLAGDEAVSQAQMAHETGMTENAVKQAYFRFRRRYRDLLCEKVAETVALPSEVEEELRHLITVLRT